MSAKILILDIETAPSVAYVWRYWQENVSPKQVLDHPHIMSFAAKWYKTNDIIYEECRKSDDSVLVKRLIELLDEADVVVAHYGSKFDLPKIKGRALVNNISPPSPFRVVDTKNVASKHFGFSSNSLEYIANVLECSVRKGGHKKFPGFELWLECLRGNDEAWEELRLYNIDDVLVLEEVYDKMLPWIDTHPNVATFVDPEIPTCVKCGSLDLHRRGERVTNTGIYPRFQCMSCGGWNRGRYSLLKRNDNILTNA